MKYIGVSGTARNGKYSVAVWNPAKKCQMYGGAYDTAEEAAEAYDIMRIQLDREYGVDTNPMKINYAIGDYTIVYTDEERRRLRVLTNRAIALKCGPGGLDAVIERNRFLNSKGRVVSGVFTHSPRDANEETLCGPDR